MILGYDDPCYQENYQKKYNIQRMMELYRKYIHIKKDLRDRIGEERKKQLGDASPILGVLYRGTYECIKITTSSDSTRVERISY